MIHHFSWSSKYVSAVLETDRQTKAERIREAERTINQRLFDADIDPSERLVLHSALYALGRLKAETGLLTKPPKRVTGTHNFATVVNSTTTEQAQRGR